MKQIKDPTPEQLEKLPKWAQGYIQRLRNLYAGAERERCEAIDTAMPSAFYVERGRTLDERQYIQSRTVQVTLPGSPHPYDLEVRVGRDGTIRLRTYGADYHYAPESENTMRIYPQWPKRERT